jgi:hypothetical protein
MSDVIAAEAAHPAIRWRAVAPNDVAVIDPMPRALFVGVGGTLALEDRTGEVLSWPASDKQFLPLSPRRVLATGTTATGLIALW